MPNRIIDLSVSLSEKTPVYPGDLPLRVDVLESTGDAMSRGRRSLNCSRIAIGMHCGTHLDAPFHFYGEGRTVDQISLDLCTGPAFLLRLPDSSRTGLIVPRDFQDYADRLRHLGKLVVCTGWSRLWGTPSYFSDHPMMTGAAARFLVECGIHLVGVDMPSVDRPPFEAHLELLGHGVVILENLTNLEQIRGEAFELIALPLKLEEREASPVRAMALEME